MGKITKIGKGRYVLSPEGIFVEKLPVAVYDVMFSQDLGFFLEEREDFDISKYTYDLEKGFHKKVLNTFKSKDKNLGVLLSGKKGTGKTVTAKKICMESGLPVLVVGSKFGGSSFEKFLAGMGKEFVCFIDEFEKIYKRESGLGGNLDKETITMLGIMDGKLPNKVLFVLTSNESYVGKYLMNRPGRIYYHKKYKGLSRDSIKEISDERLNNTSHTEIILKMSEVLGFISIDILLALIDECNLYDIPPNIAMEDLNVTVDVEENKWVAETIPLDEKGKEMPKHPWRHEWTHHGHPRIETDFTVMFNVDHSVKNNYHPDNVWPEQAIEGVALIDLKPDIQTPDTVLYKKVKVGKDSYVNLKFTKKTYKSVFRY